MVQLVIALNAGKTFWLRTHFSCEKQFDWAYVFFFTKACDAGVVESYFRHYAIRRSMGGLKRVCGEPANSARINNSPHAPHSNPSSGAWCFFQPEFPCIL